ncbi:hypothetical protein B0H14DRAFT_2423129, partial [Mycena olivaceomarginata]
VPPVMMISITHQKSPFDRVLQYDCAGNLVGVRLRGIIYGGNGHFTCRYIDAAGTVWFHDGVITGRQCRREGNICDLRNPFELYSCA